MNPTEQSGNDLCEQPVLQWTELRALAGLSLLALFMFALAMSMVAPSPYSQNASAANATRDPLESVTVTPIFEEPPVIDSSWNGIPEAR